MPKKLYSTVEAAREIGVAWITLQRWVSTGKVKAPKLIVLGNVKVRLWSRADIARVKKQLSKLYYKGKDGRRK